MNEEINNKLQRGLALTVKESWELYKYIKALEQTELNSSYNSVKTELKPCGDCISRTDALNAFKPKGISEELWMESNTYKVLTKLPSVTPQRKRGKWIEVDICNCHATLKCSVCDRVIKPTFTFGEYSYENIKEFYPFCHCGADMRGDSE